MLEIGGGVGEIQIELLKRGAARATNLELSPAYEEEAKRLLRELALEDRAERRLHDIAVEPDGVEAADIVVLHRVVCATRTTSACWERRRNEPGGCSCSAIRRATSLSRLFVGAENLASSCSGRSSDFVHPPPAMLGLLDKSGFGATFAVHTKVWQVAGLER